MSFGLDPWLFACPNNAADTPDQRAEQKAVILAMQRAVDYAYGRGVMPIASEGNGYTSRGIDLGRPTVDNDSPTFPVDTAHPRTLDNTCLLLPAESNHVVAVSATGPSGRKAYYSNYGTEQTDVAAPGGDYYDNPASTRDVTRGSLSTASEQALRGQGLIDANGNPTGPSVLRNCKVGGPCAYYQYSSGTSFSAAGGTTYRPRNGGEQVVRHRSADQLPRVRLLHLHPQPARRNHRGVQARLCGHDRIQRLLRSRHGQRVERGHELTDGVTNSCEIEMKVCRASMRRTRQGAAKERKGGREMELEMTHN
jgi:hypothetical protein